MDLEAPTSSASRIRISAACEACRATKIRCQPSEKPGVCKKCLESKRECIPRTNARTRRSRRSRSIDQSSTKQPSSNVASTTFTIEFDVPAPPELDDDFESLRDIHEQMLDSIFPSDTRSDSQMSLPRSFDTSMFPTPSSSSSASGTHSSTHSMQSLHTRPKFNLASAATLLDSFRDMLHRYPCIVLSSEETVSTLAATRPFALLAILAAASSSRTLQGHTLYDEEFRKVLGLKIVAGGERSLELLQGILIYCTCGYPFHLRPKNRQAYHYLRMAGDLVHDLEIDQVFAVGSDGYGVTVEELEKVRTLLAYYYSVTGLSTALKHLRVLSTTFTPWISKCCDLLEQHGQAQGDPVLSYLVRMTSETKAAHDVFSGGNGQCPQNSPILLRGLEAQHKDMMQRIPPGVAQSPSIKLADLFFRVYIQGGRLLRTPFGLLGTIDDSLPQRLSRCVLEFKELLEHLSAIDDSTLACFSGIEWTKFILSVILGVRVSFPLPECPDWDYGWARRNLPFEAFLQRICDDGGNLTPANKRVDVVSATRAVVRLVKAKYDHCTEQLKVPPLQISPPRSNCPMLDGSLDEYLPLWDADLGPGPEEPVQQAVYHDIWATMTMSWADDGFSK